MKDNNLKINEDGTITIPKDMVERMGGKPGDKIVTAESLYLSEEKMNIKECSRTFSIEVLLRKTWEKEMRLASDLQTGILSETGGSISNVIKKN